MLTFTSPRMEVLRGTNAVMCEPRSSLTYLLEIYTSASKAGVGKQLSTQVFEYIIKHWKLNSLFSYTSITHKMNRKLVSV